MDLSQGPILFRVDATPDQGYEAFYQCLSFAAALQRRRRGTHFFSYLDPLAVAHVITRGNNDWHPAEQLLGDPRDVGATLKEIRRLGAAAVVVAGTGSSDAYLRELKKTGVMVIAFDTDGKVHLPADLVVCPSSAPTKKAFRFDAGAQLLHGRKYAQVRGVFRRQRTIRATEQPGAFRALVAFGDDDFAGQAVPRAEQLLKAGRVDKVSILTRFPHPRYDEMKEYAADSGGKVEVVTEPKELMTRLVRGHFALTSGDSWTYELACVGIPQLMLPACPRHAAAAKKIDEEGMATLVGDGRAVTAGELDEAVKILTDDPMERLTMSRCARNRVDGRGGDRVVNGMEILLHSPSRRRPALAVAA